MKKLMIAAAAAFCGTVFALESANIVGYQNKATETAQMNWTCNTFVPVNGDTMTLGGIKVTEGFVNSSIIFLQPSGLVKTINSEDLGKTVNEQYVYWFEEDEPEDGEGWYFKADKDGEYNQNARVIAVGEGYYVQGTSKELGESLVFSGAVKDTATTLEITSAQMNWFGNCTPSKITLGDITVSESFVNSSIIFLQPSGLVKTINSEDLGKTVNEQYVYWFEEDEPEDGAGWYFKADKDGEYNQNARNIGAGEGFYVQGTSKEIGESIVIPAAL